MRRLRCWLFTRHEVDYFPEDADNVHRITFSCRCGATSVSKARAVELMREMFRTLAP